MSFESFHVSHPDTPATHVEFGLPAPTTQNRQTADTVRRLHGSATTKSMSSGWRVGDNFRGREWW